MELDAKATRVLLIDDDPVFRNLMAEVARARGVSLDPYESLLDLGSVGLIGDYTVAIVDYRLEQMTGIEIGEYLQAFFNKTPMVLVSTMDRSAILESKWPTPIAKFINKSAGCEAILLSALAVEVWNAPGEVRYDETTRVTRSHPGRRDSEEVLPE